MVPAGFLGWKLACDNLTAPGLREGGVAPHGLAEQQGLAAGPRRERMSIGTIILIILVIALLGGFSGIGGGPFYGTGYYGGGGLGLIIVILLILLLLGRL
jgi:hypothetical protein